MTHDDHHHNLGPGIAGATVVPADHTDLRSASAGLSTEYHSEVLREQATLIGHQWSYEIRRGLVRGFLLSGPPGVGKTTLARRLISELGSRFPAPGGRAGVVAVFVDGATIARARYGDSEQRIRAMFEAARQGLGNPLQRVLLVFDDVESILMARGADHAREWHLSQDSVFFHSVDEMDTSRTAIVMTTNRPDLVDDAIRDRFLEYRIDYPSADMLLEAARHRCRQQGMDDAALRRLDVAMRDAVTDRRVRSLRDAEHFAARFWISTALGAEEEKSSK